MRRPPHRFAFLAIFLFAGPLLAQSDPAKAQAEKRYEEGVELHKSGKDEEAYVRFAQAYAIARSPPILFDLARTEQLTGRLVDAAVHYKDYLALSAHPLVSEDQRQKARAFLAQVEAQVGHLVIDAPPKAKATVDGVAAEIGRAIDVLPGAHTVRGELGEHSDTLTMACFAGQTVTATLSLEPAEAHPIAKQDEPGRTLSGLPLAPSTGTRNVPPSDALPPHASFWTSKHITLVALGAGVVAAAAVGGGFFADAASADQQAKSLTQGEACAGSTSPACAHAAQLKSRYDSDQIAGGVALGVGGAALLSGVVALLVWPERDSSRTAWLTPLLGARAGGFELGGRF